MDAVRSFVEKLLYLGCFITIKADARTMAAHTTPASQKILEEKSEVCTLAQVNVLMLIKPVLKLLWEVFYIVSHIFTVSLMFIILFFIHKQLLVPRLGHESCPYSLNQKTMLSDWDQEIPK
jgi:hypothetical protein